MEKWNEYRKGIIPKDQYAGKISYKEGMKPVIDLQSWYRGENTNYVKIEFNQALSVRVFEEHSAFCDVFDESEPFWKDHCSNVIYEVENGDYVNDLKKAARGKLDKVRIYHYVIFTLNYYYEIVTDSEPVIIAKNEKEEKGKLLEYFENYRQEMVDLIFKHLEEPVYMSKDGGYYVAYIELTAGEYYYKYLQGDGLELIDKKNKDIFIDESGCWSVLTIDEDGVVEKEIESSATLIEYGISHKMMEVVPDKAESKVFDVNKDKEAVCLLSFNEIKGLHVVTVAWYNPSGELYKFAENDFGSYEEADDDKVMVRFWLNLAGIDEADFGDWTVRAFLDGEMIKEDNIIISGDGIKKLEYED